ncbi:MAG TPA: T9SS type A sorting domain-containing protein [Bacteroidia bacterium]|jgi:hypothetical protein|nr:T9SS type A sorting domain-containing protein [Bacteroidia bacterium]
MKKLLLIILFVLNLLPFGENTRGVAQNGWNAYLNGPSGSFLSGQATCIAIDKYGNKYIGFISNLVSSPAAIAKYNVVGGFWTYYNTTNTPILPCNRVNTIAADTAGNVWIGTPSGLVKYDGTSFTVFTTTNGLPYNDILAIHCVGTQVYIGTIGGLTRYNGATFYNYNVANGSLPCDSVYCITAETPNKLWLGTQFGAIEFNINSIFTSSNYNGYGFDKTNCIFIDSNNKKWFGTQNMGVWEFDYISFKPASITYSNIIGANLPTTCKDIAKGPHGGPIFFTSTVGYHAPPTSTTNAAACLLELLPNSDTQPYYLPNNNYTIGNFLETDPIGEIYIANNMPPYMGGYLKFMFSFMPWQYNPFMLGPGGGVNNKNFKFLDVNRVRAGIANRGDMHWDIGGTNNPLYEVPKGGGAHSVFCSTFWIGGLDASNQLHMGAQTYRQAGGDFWPGPLDTISATSDSATFVKYDKIWKIDYNDINTFITQFNLGNVPLTYTPTTDILSWPAKGTGNNSRNLAPFVDVNNNGIYDPLVGGDYPQIKGDQALYYIFNDNFLPHSQTNGLPLGIEVHVMAYAYGCPNFINGKNELAYTTFYNYKIFNRSNNNYTKVQAGIFNDADLGCYIDDQIACYVQDNLGFEFNADNYDQNCSGEPGYLNYPPAQGTTILKGPIAPANDGIDNNNDGIIDEPGEECLMNKFVYYTTNFSTTASSPTTQPTTAYQYYNYISGKWRDSTDFTCGGNGYGGTLKTDFVYPWSFYPGLPCPLWADNYNPPGDRRHIISIGPFNLNAKESTEIEFAYVWAVDSTVFGGNIASASKLITENQKVRSFYYSKTQTTCLPSITVPGFKENSLNNKLLVYPNPASSTLFIKNTEGFGGTTEIKITTVLGKSVHRSKINDANAYPIDISGLSAGVYFVVMDFNGQSVVKKFVKD